MHLIVDGFGGNPERLASEELVRELLDRYPDEIGMTKIALPFVQRYVGSKPEDWGISGFVLIAESHIALHTFPTRAFVWIDVFSCKSFDPDTLVWDMANQFEIRAAFVKKLPRGLEYPHSIDEAQPLLRLEREQRGSLVLAAPWRLRDTRS